MSEDIRKMIDKVKNFNIHQIIELNNRTPIGKGKDHVVYDYHGDPSKVIKIAWDNPDATNRQIVFDTQGNIISKDYTKLDPKHIEMFIKNPDLFPKVFKYTDRYAIIEKLNTKKVEQDEIELLNQLKPYVNIDEMFDSVSFNIYVMLTDKWYIKRGIFNNLFNKMVESGENLTLFEKYVNFINKVIEKMNSFGGKSNYIDVRASNLGYDKENNLKLLDF